MTKPETEKLPPHHFETGTGQPLFTAEQMLAALRAQGGGEWMLVLAKEIKANAEDHPGETMSNFALQWADMLAARAIASTPDAAPDAEVSELIDDLQAESYCLREDGRDDPQLTQSANVIDRAVTFLRVLSQHWSNGDDNRHDVGLLMKAVDDALRRSCESGGFNNTDEVIPWMLDRYNALLRRHSARANNGHADTIVPAPAPGKLAELIRKTEEAHARSAGGEGRE